MLIDYIASALVSLHEFWVKDMVFSVDLLKQFLEDMEAYSNVSWAGEKEREGGRDGVCMYIHACTCTCILYTCTCTCSYLCVRE